MAPSLQSPPPDTVFDALLVKSSVTATIKTSVTSGLPFLEALRRAQTPDVSQEDRERLLLCAEIVEACGDNFKLCELLLSTGLDQNLDDLARKYYCANDPIASTSDARKVFLFRSPTGVFLALLDSGNFVLEKRISTTVIAILETLARNRFNVQSGSLGSILTTPTCKAIFSAVSSDEAIKAQELVEALYRLHPVVVDAEDLIDLIEAGYTSARSIASIKSDDFTDTMGKRGLSFDQSASIQLEAIRVDQRNEAVWADIIRSRRAIPVLAMASHRPDDEPPIDSITTNLTTLFQDLDSVAVDDSTSVLSPASYLVDLLKMLKDVRLKSPSQIAGKDATNALDVVLHRRPDIATLKLSRANTETPMMYMALAIVVMEKHLGALLGATKDDSRKEVYTAISGQMVPMATFPYSDSISSIREMFLAHGYTRLELLSLFQADGDLANRVRPLPQRTGGSDSDFDQHIAAAHATHERRAAIEILGLQPLDLHAISREAYLTPALFRLLQDEMPELAAQTYAEAIQLRAGCELWGFDSLSQMLQQLKLVKNELLPRSGLSPTQLNTVLKTRFMGNRLVVTLAKGTEFSDHLKDTSIHESLLVPSAGVDSNEGTLSERTCLDLQAFIRLQSRLGWSTEQLDAVVVALARRSQIYDNDTRRHFVLDCEFIERLGVACQLAKNLGVPLEDLLPFWAPMDAGTETSLYSRLFLRSGYVQQCKKLALVHGDVVPDSTMGDVIAPVMQAIGISQADYAVYMEILGFDANTPWTLSTAGQLYAHHRFSQLLGLSGNGLVSASEKPHVHYYRQWWTACTTQSLVGNPFLDPQSTRASLAPWIVAVERETRDGAALVVGDSKNDTIENTLDMLLPAVDSIDPSTRPEDMKTLSELLRELAAVESWATTVGIVDLPDVEAVQSYSAETLLELCSRLLGPTMAKGVSDMANGQFRPDNESIVRIFCQEFKTTPDVISDALKLPVPQQLPAETEVALANRRKALIQLMVPQLKCRGQVEAVHKTLMAAIHADKDGPLLPSLLGGRIASTDTPEMGLGQSSTTTLMSYFQSLASKVDAWKTGPADGDVYFFPPETATYHFLTSKPTGNLSIGQQPAEFAPGTKRVSTAQLLRQGQPVHLFFSDGLSIKDLTYSTASGDTEFGPGMICPIVLAAAVCEQLGRLKRSLDVAKQIGLDAGEISFHQTQEIDLYELDMAKLARIRTFARVRKAFNITGEALMSYSQFLARIVGSAPATKSETNLTTTAEETTEAELTVRLVDETERLVRLSREDIVTFFDTEWPAHSATARASRLIDLSALLKLAKCCRMALSLSVPLSILYQWARCPLPPTPIGEEGFDVVDAVHTALSSATSASNALLRAGETLSTKRQKVLQEFLIRMPSSKISGIRSADDLSAYLLMDVRTGPAQQTSPIAQAIASVQTFVQRCFLGLEKKYGVATDQIDQAKWRWMGKYSLWQANRKVFLYPENWLEPSLRDNKTQPFSEMESKMMQSNLNKDVITQLLRDYVYAAHDVADLLILSCLWEGTNGFRGNFHLFGRTRTAPYIFHHRQLVVSGPNTAAVTYEWLPWVKMEIDIQTHEASADRATTSQPGSYLLPALFKQRLFLFIPQITRNTVPAKPVLAGTSMYKAAQENDGVKTPEESWDVKMAWAEMRNGKWSSKFVTATGIEVKQEEAKPLMPVSAFRFRLGTRKSPAAAAAAKPTENDIMQIYCDKWQSVTEGVSEAGKQTPGKFVNLGMFEMQGPRMRLVSTKSSGDVGSTTQAELEFGRMTYGSAAKDAATLAAEIKTVKTGLDNEQHSLLAIPDPTTAAGTDYQLTWPLSYDNQHPFAASGLVVEHATPSQTHSFFGYPQFNGNNYDTQLRVTQNSTALTHPVSLSLVESIADRDGFECIFDSLERIPIDTVSEIYGQDGDTYHELFRPGALYNWELGFHAVAILMERLLATQQFDLALELSRLVFDPARDDVKLDSTTALSLPPDPSRPGPLSNLDRCWRFVPFKWSKVRLAGSARDVIQRLAPEQNTSPDIANWVAHPFSPHAVARSRPAVYMKRFVMKVIEILIASGDEYFRQDSLEAMPLATQRYVEASELFGPAPMVMDSPTRPVSLTYAKIRDVVNDFATASVDLELEFPFFVDPWARNQTPPPETQTRDGTLGFVRSTYFGVPANPQMQALRGLIDDRLYKIRNGLDINGNPRSLPLFDPPIDPGQLVAAVQGEGGTAALSSLLSAQSGPMPNYRARFLLGHATAMCAELMALSDSYLSIKEKRDGEALSLLRMRQERGVMTLLGEVKKSQLDEANLAVTALRETRKGHVTRLKYYLALAGEPADRIPSGSQGDGAGSGWQDLQQSIGQVTQDDLRMSPEEVLEMAMTESASRINTVATALEQTTAVLMALPKITAQVEPMGVGTSMQMDASIIANAMMAGAGIIRAGAQAAGEVAGRAARKGQMIKQLQDRRMQANSAGRDIAAVDQQIQGAIKRVAAAQADITAHTQQIADSRESEAWLRSKYTSDRLYSWLDSETRRLAHGAYLAALDLARTAERALAFEYGPRAPSASLLPHSAWDEARDGLLAARNLGAGIHRLESFYINNTPHDFELTKTVSLRQVNPGALVRLRMKGAAEFDLPEVLFDHDFPGHYCRRIKTVTATIPCVVGPCTGVNATLRLLQHCYRLRSGPSASPGAGYYDDDVAGSDQPRFHTDRVPIGAVALSSASQDSGTFELNFTSSDRYVPFEGAGVISSWRLELPAPFPQFDYRSISDVLFTVRYTALDGGALWQQQATDAVRAFRGKVAEQTSGMDKMDSATGGAMLLVDLPADFPNEWNLFKKQLKAASPDSAQAVTMDLGRLPDLLPFWCPRQTTSILGVSAFVQPFAAGDGWDDSDKGAFQLLGRNLVEENDMGNENLKVLVDAPAQVKEDNSQAPTVAAVDNSLKETNLELSVVPKIFKGKAPQNFWATVHYSYTS